MTIMNIDIILIMYNFTELLILNFQLDRLNKIQIELNIKKYILIICHFLKVLFFKNRLVLIQNYYFLKP